MPCTLAASRRSTLALTRLQARQGQPVAMGGVAKLRFAWRAHTQPVSVNISEARLSRIELALLAAYCLEQFLAFRVQQLTRAIE